jgi:hypothetical protein
MKIYEVTIKGYVTLPDGEVEDEQTVEDMTSALLQTAHPRTNGYAVCSTRGDGQRSKKTATLHVNEVVFGKVELV